MAQQFSLNLADKRKPTPLIAEGPRGELGVAVWAQDPDKVKELGQVETPPEVASVMASWLLSKKPKTILDPAVGPGALLRACHPKAGKYKPKLIGVELDADTVTFANHRVPKGTKLIEGDYLLIDIDPVPAIIANPPYVKATTYDYSNEDWEAIEATLKLSLDRLTNVYALFVLKIWHDLAEGGRAAIIVPAEFLNANYGDEIKDALLKITKPVGIAVFNPSVSLFDKALTTSAIIFFEKSKKDPHPVWSSIVNSLPELEHFIGFLNTGQRHALQEHSIVDVSGWSNTDKWINPLLRAAQGPAIAQPHVGFTRKLSDYYRCKRGIATGANDYFCLSVPEITELGLSLNDLTPCITKAADAPSLFFTAEDFNALRESGRSCYLLDPTTDNAAIKAYLRKGEELKIHERFLTKSRKQWYKPEKREAAQIWVGVFSRERVGYVLNEAGMKNLTCFHGLYITRPQVGLDVLTLLFLNSRYGAEAFASISRFYGSGLNKVEPKDVESMPCPQFPVLAADTIAAIKQEMVLRTRNARGTEAPPNFDDLCQLHLGL